MSVTAINPGSGISLLRHGYGQRVNAGAAPGGKQPAAPGGGQRMPPSSPPPDGDVDAAGIESGEAGREKLMALLGSMQAGGSFASSQAAGEGVSGGAMGLRQEFFDTLNSLLQSIQSGDASGVQNAASSLLSLLNSFNSPTDASAATSAHKQPGLMLALSSLLDSIASGDMDSARKIAGTIAKFMQQRPAEIGQLRAAGGVQTLYNEFTV